MWTRKTEKDIAEERKRLLYDVTAPLGAGVCVLFGAFVSLWIRPRPWIAPTLPMMSFLEAAKKSVTFAIFTVLLAYLLQVVTGKPISKVLSDRCVICNKCARVKVLDPVARCECNGTFEDLELWKWTES